MGANSASSRGAMLGRKAPRRRGSALRRETSGCRAGRALPSAPRPAPRSLRRHPLGPDAPARDWWVDHVEDVRRDGPTSVVRCRHCQLRAQVIRGLAHHRAPARPGRFRPARRRSNGHGLVGRLPHTLRAAMNAPLRCLRPAIGESSSGGIRPRQPRSARATGCHGPSGEESADASAGGGDDRRAGSPRPAARRGVAPLGARAAAVIADRPPDDRLVRFDRTVTLRAMARAYTCASDQATDRRLALVALYDHLSRDTRYYASSQSCQRLPPDWARLLATVDYRSRLAPGCRSARRSRHAHRGGPLRAGQGRRTRRRVRLRRSGRLAEPWARDGAVLELLAAAEARTASGRFRCLGARRQPAHARPHRAPGRDHPALDRSEP